MWPWKKKKVEKEPSHCTVEIQRLTGRPLVITDVLSIRVSGNGHWLKLLGTEESQMWIPREQIKHVWINLKE